MQTDYSRGAAPNYSPGLLRAIAVWRKAGANGDRYGFPLTDPWGDAAYPLIDGSWQFECVLPVGMPVSEITVDHGDRVRCRVAGVELFTAAFVVTQ